MKKLLAVFTAAALLLPITGLAETDYVSLGTLCGQAAEGWHETCQSHGREVTANVDIDTMPAADACAVYQVKAVSFDADALASLQRLPGMKAYVYRDIVLNADRTDDKIDYSPFYGGAMDTDQEINCENGEEPHEDALDCDLTYAQWKAKINSDMTALTGMTLDDYRLDDVSVGGPSYKAKMRNGVLVRGEKLTATGYYAMRAIQLLDGIPILDSFAEDTPTGWIVCNYCSAGYYSYQFGGAVVTAAEETDVPLLSFDAMKAVLRQQIAAGTMRGIDEMEFGYLLCYRKTDTGRQFITVPAWRVLGGYCTDLNREHVMPYYDARDTDGSQTVPMAYRDYFYNAQTGEMIQTAALTGNCKPIPADEILTWDAVGK